MGAPDSIIKEGSNVWFKDPLLGWKDGKVIKTEGEKLRVSITNGKEVVTSLSKVFPKDIEAPPRGVDDMTTFSYLDEPGVLQNLAVRYELNEIYTYIGNILIAINPIQRLPHLYDTRMKEKYKGAAFGELGPHIFAIANVAYRAMRNEGKSSSILVSGESGAGKTYTTNMLMSYLAYLGGQCGEDGQTVEQKVLKSNHVLEAFGNTKTVRNDNSSRFGKYVKIQFDKSGKISGAAIQTYLLERSRVRHISDPERNYHCFYHLCAAPTEVKKKYKLESSRSYHYLNQSKSFKRKEVNDAEEYLATRTAMDIIGFSKEEQDAIFRVVSAILHLGNIEFAKGEETDSSVLKSTKSRHHLDVAAELLMCNVDSLKDALIKRMPVTPEEVARTLDPKAALGRRDALAETIYSLLFDWIVKKINNLIGYDPNSESLIGLLDVCGFESFEQNSFEQFCINFTSEKLQQHFKKHVYKMEQKEYTKEEIDCSNIEFVDNKDVLDLIEKIPGGIIALLDEACMSPKSTHETFAEKLYQTFAENKRFIKLELPCTSFTISHYAGEVSYLANQFLDKNKDYVVAEHQALLTSSKCQLVCDLFPPLPEEVSKSSKFSSIGSLFKLQLQSLMEALNSTEPHFIRCVKPNNDLKRAIFENQNIIQQLCRGGVLEAIRVISAGYPTRQTFDEFLLRFGALAHDVWNGYYDEKVECQKILDKLKLKDYKIGKTKVFLRAGQLAELDARRADYIAEKQKILISQFPFCRQKFWKGLFQKEQQMSKTKEFRVIKEDQEKLDTLEKILNNACVALEPKSSEYESREKLVKAFNKIARESYGIGECPEIVPYGSFAMDLFTSESDLDLSINFNNEVENKQSDVKKLKVFKKHLEKVKDFVWDIEGVWGARVPIIRLVDAGTGIDCDISVDNNTAILKSWFVRFISSFDKRFRQLCFLIKAWAKHNCINSTREGTLSSFSIVLLVAFHLQTQEPPILPPFSAILKGSKTEEETKKYFQDYGKRNKECLAVLLFSFFFRLANVEKLWADGLCASTYNGLWTYNKLGNSINVEDFLDRSENPARGAKNFDVIYELIYGTRDSLIKFMKGEMDETSLKEFLFGSI